MSLLIVGSIALDSIRTPSGEALQVLGGSATYAALAAQLWTPVALVGAVGTDFPSRYTKLFDRRGINGPGLLRVPGRTFRWKGSYNAAGEATTLSLDLGVLRTFRPVLPRSLRRIRTAFLGNIHPDLQEQVLHQLIAPKLTACDSRADWIQSQRKGFLRLLKQVDMIFLNDSEARLLTGIHSLVQATRVMARLGPKVAVVKKGEHGVLVAFRDAFFSLPGYPVSRVVDPTGAGDAFAGAALGYFTQQKKITWAVLCRGIQYASVVASMTIESFGPANLLKATRAQVRRRMKSFRSLARVVIP